MLQVTHGIWLSGSFRVFRKKELRVFRKKEKRNDDLGCLLPVFGFGSR